MQNIKERLKNQLKILKQKNPAIDYKPISDSKIELKELEGSTLKKRMLKLIKELKTANIFEKEFEIYNKIVDQLKKYGISFEKEQTLLLKSLKSESRYLEKETNVRICQKIYNEIEFSLNIFGTLFEFYEKHIHILEEKISKKSMDDFSDLVEVLEKEHLPNKSEEKLKKTISYLKSMINGLNENLVSFSTIINNLKSISGSYKKKCNRDFLEVLKKISFTLEDMERCYQLKLSMGPNLMSMFAHFEVLYLIVKYKLLKLPNFEYARKNLDAEKNIILSQQKCIKILRLLKILSMDSSIERNRLFSGFFV